MSPAPIAITSSDGLRLEGALDRPEQPAAVLVLCHPHPKMGGTMNAPLLMAVRDRLLDQGWAVVRFNFRGIGASEGKPSTGTAEVADAQGAVTAARQGFPGLPVAVAGWSFGGAVALHLASKDRGLAACVGIAPAIVASPEITDGAPPPEDFAFDGPTLLVCGANDEQISPDDCRSWSEQTGARYEEVSGANHFFWAKYEPLAELVGDFLDDAV